MHRILIWISCSMNNVFKWIHSSIEWVKSHPFLTIWRAIESLGLLGVIVALGDLTAQRDARIQYAFALLGDENTGNFGKRQALLILNKPTWCVPYFDWPCLGETVPIDQIRPDLLKSGEIIINLAGIDLSDAKMQSIHGHFTIFQDSDLSKVNFENATLYGTDFSRAQLNDTNMKNADLEKANLQEATLTDVDFYGANLSGTDITGAKDMKRANFECAWYREDTPPIIGPGEELPSEIKPCAAGTTIEYFKQKFGCESNAWGSDRTCQPSGITDN